MLVSYFIIYCLKISCVTVQHNVVALLQEGYLASEIVLHGGVLCRADVIVVDIGKYSDLVVLSVDTVHLHGLGRNFHYTVCTAFIYSHVEVCLEFNRLRCGESGLKNLCSNINLMG